MSVFFMPEVFPAEPPSSKQVLILRALEWGDLDDADFFLATLPEAQKDGALYAQLCAAVSYVRGDFQSAYDLLTAALPQLQAPHLRAKFCFQLASLAEALHQSDNALEFYEAAVVDAPSQPVFCLMQAEKIWEIQGPNAGRAAFEAAVKFFQNSEIWAAWIRLERAAKNYAFAVSILARARELHSEDENLISLSAVNYISIKEYHKALAVLSELADDHKSHPAVMYNMAAAFMGLGQFTDALALFRQVTEIEPQMYEAHMGAVKAAHALYDVETVQYHAQIAVKLRDDNPEAVNLWAQSLFHAGRENEAADLLRDAVIHTPHSHSLHYFLAVVLHDSGKYEEAERYLRRAMELNPDADQYHDLLGSIILQHGDFSEAEQHSQIAMKAIVEQAEVFHSNYLFALHYNPEVSPQKLYAEHCAYGQRFGGQAIDTAAPLRNVRDPDRKLRIAYISPDFRAHSVAFFMMPIVDRHDRDQFEVFLYSNTHKRDSVSSWFMEAADHWREIHGRVFDNIRQQLVDDEIDILIDLVGHTGNNLLPVFARRAAPVQVSYLGYPNTTGVPAMDYRLVDEISDPLETADAFATEQLVRLPDSFLCYRMMGKLPDIPVGPVERDLPMTYGSFNNIMKLNDVVFDAWAQILTEVPDSRLLLKSKFLANTRTLAWVQDAFACRGISTDRLELRMHVPSLQAHLDLYSEMDLALDTFPYNGTTTTCEAVSMGVPVLGVRGEHHCARVGQSLVSSLGLADEFLADNVDDYVRRAVAFAQRRQELADIRKGMRSRLLSSPLCNEHGFMKNLEAAYRKMWVDWCANADRCPERTHSLTSSVFEEELRAKCVKN